MSFSNKKPSTKVASSLGDSAPMINTVPLLMNTTNFEASEITYTRQDDRAMNNAYGARVKSHN